MPRNQIDRLEKIPSNSFLIYYHLIVLSGKQNQLRCNVMHYRDWNLHNCGRKRDSKDYKGGIGRGSEKVTILGA